MSNITRANTDVSQIVGCIRKLHLCLNLHQYSTQSFPLNIETYFLNLQHITRSLDLSRKFSDAVWQINNPLTNCLTNIQDLNSCARYCKKLN